jgi:recombination protein RecR
MLPKAIKETIDELSKLPGIGPKSAERLAFFLLRREQRDLESFSRAIEKIKKGTVLCSNCFNITEHSPCAICDDPNRDKKTICVVEEPMDVFAIEKTGGFQGQYHVLHGALSPIDNIGPEDIRLNELLEKIESESVEEIILATNPNPKGEATALYILQKLKIKNRNIKATHLAHGLPLGGEIEYADHETLKRALKGRLSY